MSIFNPNPDKPANIIDTTLLNNYAYVEPSRNTEFGEIDPKNNQILRYNINEQSEAETSNNTTNIRITESELAIRNRGFNYFKGKFNPGFPTSNVYTFCKPELSIVFQNGAYQYTRKISDPRSIRHGAGDGGYPPKISIQKVVDSVQQNQYGKGFSGSSISPAGNTITGCACPNGTQPDPITGLCANTELCIPDPIEPCPEPEFVNLKNVIQGYAFYVDRIKTVNIPNIGRRTVRCAGGHRCNRTVFMPKLQLSNSSIIEASNVISMDNLPQFANYTPQQNPIFDNVLTPGEVGDSFTFTVPNPALLDNTCLVSLECLLPFCHNGITMIFLVGQRSDNDEYVLLFADCVAPGAINAEFLGSVPCNDDDPPIECCYYGHINDCLSPPLPPPPCNPFNSTQAVISINNAIIPLECLGDPQLKSDLESTINQTHILNLTNVDNNQITADTFTIQPIGDVGSIVSNIFFLLSNDGNDNWTASVQLQILLPQSPYPFIYGLAFSDSVQSTDFCNFTLIDGTRNLSDGINAPFCTGDGSDAWTISLV